MTEGGHNFNIDLFEQSLKPYLAHEQLHILFVCLCLWRKKRESSRE